MAFQRQGLWGSNGDWQILANIMIVGFSPSLSIEMLVYNNGYTIHGGCHEMGLEALRNKTSVWN